jgi:hypothetical protein
VGKGFIGWDRLDWLVRERVCVHGRAPYFMRGRGLGDLGCVNNSSPPHHSLPDIVGHA